MKLTITIEDEQGAETLVHRQAADRPAVTPAESPAEAAPSSAGAPPAWLVEELQGGESRPEAAGPPDALDAGAAMAGGNGFVPMPG